MKAGILVGRESSRSEGDNLQNQPGCLVPERLMLAYEKDLKLDGWGDQQLN